MIFHPDLAEKVLAGVKTQTRRRVKGAEPCRYVAGRTYSVQSKRGGKGLGRIRVLFIDRVPVQPLTESDARAEGFASPNEFFNRWHNMYGPGSTREDCWRIAFEVVA